MKDSRSNLVDVDVYLHHQTQAAVLVSTDGERASAVWVPKSACELDHKSGSVYEMTLEQGVAEEKGLV